jgi:hypothetical protein
MTRSQARVVEEVVVLLPLMAAGNAVTPLERCVLFL